MFGFDFYTPKPCCSDTFRGSVFNVIATGFCDRRSTLLKLRTEQREGFSTLGQREPSTVDYSGLHDPQPLIYRRHQPAKWSPKKAKNLRGNKQTWPAGATHSFLFTHRLFVWKDSWRFSAHCTYLSHVFFRWLYNRGRILSSDFPRPWGRLLQMPNKGIWGAGESVTVSSVLLSSVPSRSLSTAIVIYFLKHLISTFFKYMRFGKTEGNFPAGSKPKFWVYSIYSCYCAIDFQLFTLRQREQITQNLILEIDRKQIASPWPWLHRQWRNSGRSSGLPTDFLSTTHLPHV